MDVNSTEMKERILAVLKEFTSASMKVEAANKNLHEVSQKLKSVLGFSGTSTEALRDAAHKRIGEIHLQELRSEL